MKVELIDLRERFKEEEKAIFKIIKRVLSKGNLILTKEVMNFEKSICMVWIDDFSIWAISVSNRYNCE